MSDIVFFHCTPFSSFFHSLTRFLSMRFPFVPIHSHELFLPNQKKWYELYMSLCM